MSRVRPWMLATAGLTMLAATVAFFVVTAVRDDQLLRDGTRTTATVLSVRGTSAWPLLNQGRVVVRYATPEGVLTRGVWLDDSAHAPRGGTWTVVYDPHDPGRVRSLSDPNDPYPWLAPLLLVGLLGVSMTVTAGVSTVRRARRRRLAAVAAAAPPGATRVLLRRAWYHRQVPYVEVAGDQVRLHLPSFFGAREFTVDKSLVRFSTEEPDLGNANWVFTGPVTVPYAPTSATVLRAPNLTLLFAEPQRIPPLRLARAAAIRLSWRRSRSKAGVVLDGISLCVRDPDEARRALQSAGLPATAATSFLRDNRPITYDPAAVERAATSRRLWRWVGFLVVVVAAGLQAMRFVPDQYEKPAYALLALAMLDLGWLSWRAWRLDRQAQRN